MKCGSTTLYRWMRKHPRLTKAVMKEAHFFDDHEPPLSRSGEAISTPGRTRLTDTPRPTDYLKILSQGTLGAHSKQKVSLWDITPSYLTYPPAAKEISKMFPHMKFIVSLRDPVDRMYSQFVYDLKKVPSDLPIQFDKKAKEQLELWRNITSSLGLTETVERGGYGHSISDIQCFTSTSSFLPSGQQVDDKRKGPYWEEATWKIHL